MDAVASFLSRSVIALVNKNIKDPVNVDLFKKYLHGHEYADHVQEVQFPANIERWDGGQDDDNTKDKAVVTFKTKEAADYFLKKFHKNCLSLKMVAGIPLDGASALMHDAEKRKRLCCDQNTFHQRSLALCDLPTNTTPSGVQIYLQKTLPPAVEPSSVESVLYPANAGELGLKETSELCAVVTFHHHQDLQQAKIVLQKDNQTVYTLPSQSFGSSVVFLPKLSVDKLCNATGKPDINSAITELQQMFGVLIQFNAEEPTVAFLGHWIRIKAICDYINGQLGTTSQLASKSSPSAKGREMEPLSKKMKPVVLDNANEMRKSDVVARKSMDKEYEMPKSSQSSDSNNLTMKGETSKHDTDSEDEGEFSLASEHPDERQGVDTTGPSGITLADKATAQDFFVTCSTLPKNPQQMGSPSASAWEMQMNSNTPADSEDSLDRSKRKDMDIYANSSDEEQAAGYDPSSRVVGQVIRNRYIEAFDEAAKPKHQQSRIPDRSRDPARAVRSEELIQDSHMDVYDAGAGAIPKRPHAMVNQQYVSPLFEKDGDGKSRSSPLHEKETQLKVPAPGVIIDYLQQVKNITSLLEGEFNDKITVEVEDGDEYGEFLVEGLDPIKTEQARKKLQDAVVDAKSKEVCKRFSMFSLDAIKAIVGQQQQKFDRVFVQIDAEDKCVTVIGDDAETMMQLIEEKLRKTVERPLDSKPIPKIVPHKKRLFLSPDLWQYIDACHSEKVQHLIEMFDVTIKSEKTDRGFAICFLGENADCVQQAYEAFIEVQKPYQDDVIVESFKVDLNFLNDLTVLKKRYPKVLVTVNEDKQKITLLGTTEDNRNMKNHIQKSIKAEKFKQELDEKAAQRRLEQEVAEAKKNMEKEEREKRERDEMERRQKEELDRAMVKEAAALARGHGAEATNSLKDGPLAKDREVQGGRAEYFELSVNEDTWRYMRRCMHNDISKILGESVSFTSYYVEKKLMVKFVGSDAEEAGKSLSSLVKDVEAFVCIQSLKYPSGFNVMQSVQAIVRQHNLNIATKEFTDRQRVQLIGREKDVQICLRELRSAFKSLETDASKVPTITPWHSIATEKKTLLPKSYKCSLSATMVHVLVADITTMDVDIIVNAANCLLEHGGGLAEAIASAAGIALEDDCRTYMKVTRQDQPIPVGDNFISVPGRLPCNHVMHAVGPAWYDYHSKDKCKLDLEETFYICMRDASRRRLRSIAMPALSSGIFGVPIPVVTEALADALVKFLTQHERTSLLHIYIVDIIPESIDIIQRRLAECFLLAKMDRFTGECGQNQGGARRSVPQAQSREMCAVCHDGMKNPVTLHCGHRFCKSCVEQSSRVSGKTCPSCRQSYS